MEDNCRAIARLEAEGRITRLEHRALLKRLAEVSGFDLWELLELFAPDDEIIFFVDPSQDGKLVTH